MQDTEHPNNDRAPVETPPRDAPSPPSGGRRPAPARALAWLAGALVRPDLAFRGSGALPHRPFAVVLLLFALSVAGQRLVSGYDQNPDVQLLALGEVESRLGTLMQAAPPEARQQARDRMLRMLGGARGTALISVSVVTSGVAFVLLALEAWLLLSVLAQFAGGEERRGPSGERRDSLLLVLVAFVPLALRKLAEGVVMSFKDPALAANALTLADYRALSKVRFDLWELAGLPALPPLPAYLLRRLTDPFSLWSLCILVVGGTAVWRMQVHKTLVQAAVLLVVLAAQSALFAAVGLPWET